MLPGLELMACGELAVPVDVMRHVVRVESSFNPYAIGVVGGRLVRQPRNQAEAVSTARMLEEKGFNFSLGIAQVNRYNLASYGLDSYERAFQTCPNLQAGSRILAECHGRAAGDWGKAFSCYYSGNFSTGFRHGYVQKVFASWNAEAGARPDADASAIPLAGQGTNLTRRATPVHRRDSLLQRRIRDAARNVEPARAQMVEGVTAMEDQQTAASGPTPPSPAPAAALPGARQPVLLQPDGAPPLGLPPARAPASAATAAVARVSPTASQASASGPPAPEPPTSGDAAFVF